MKKILLSIILYASIMGISYAQVSKETVLQPTHVVGRRINADGVITKELVSDFSYRDDGKLYHYDFPEYSIIGQFSYSDDYISHESIFHRGLHAFTETNDYSYENGQIKTVVHINPRGESLHMLYSYYEDGRLKRKDQRDDLDDDYHQHWLYEYEDEGKTVVMSYWTSWVLQGLLLREKTTSQYDDEYVLLFSLVETYNMEGELTSIKKTTYSYTSCGMVENETTQILNDGEWVNSNIVHYDYDDSNRLVERFEGTWDAELDEWVGKKKITFDYSVSEDGQLYTVSFYKMEEGEWQWDDFACQSILFGSEMRSQQRMLSYMSYDDMHGLGHINQIEFALVETYRPVYMGEEDHQQLSCGVYPNPGRDKLNVVSPLENSIIRLYNLQGQLIKACPFDFSIEISTENLPSGIYLWEIWNGSQKGSSGKWVKEKAAFSFLPVQHRIQSRVVVHLHLLVDLHHLFTCLVALHELVDGGAEVDVLLQQHV